LDGDRRYQGHRLYQKRRPYRLSGTIVVRISRDGRRLEIRQELPGRVHVVLIKEPVGY